MTNLLAGIISLFIVVLGFDIETMPVVGNEWLSIVFSAVLVNIVIKMWDLTTATFFLNKYKKKSYLSTKDKKKLEVFILLVIFGAICIYGLFFAICPYYIYWFPQLTLWQFVLYMIITIVLTNMFDRKMAVS